MTEVYGIEGAQMDQAALLVALGLIVLLLIVHSLFRALLHCMMFHKAGYSWALGLLMLVPVANLIMPLVLAFGDWPVCRQVRALRLQTQMHSSGIRAGADGAAVINRSKND